MLFLLPFLVHGLPNLMFYWILGCFLFGIGPLNIAVILMGIPFLFNSEVTSRAFD